MRRRGVAPAEVAEAGLVLDAGALIALEGRAVALLAALDRAMAGRVPVRIPAGALAQAWRGGDGRGAALARLLKQPVIVLPMLQSTALAIGRMLAVLSRGRESGVDVVDAHVALITTETRSIVWTSDRTDLTTYGVDQRRIRFV